MFDNIEKNILGLVVFDDIKIHYPVDQDLRVVFTIDPSVRASTRDWVGIYPVGWSAFESCLTYLWGIGRHFENSCRTRYLVFKARDLRKATCGTHYQFVYVSKYLEVLGVSQYFQFRTSETLVEAARNASKLYMRFVANDSSILSEPTLNNSISHNCKLAAAHQRKVFTTCGQCKNLFDTQEMNSGLAKKVDNLEKTVEDLKTQKLSGLPSSLVWDEDIERTRFHKFLNNIYNPPKPDGSGERKSFESRLSAVKSLVCAMDDVIAKAEKIKVGLQKMIESPIDGELCLANSNAIGSLAGSAGPEDPVRSEPPVQELPQRQGSSHAS